MFEYPHELYNARLSVRGIHLIQSNGVHRKIFYKKVYGAYVNYKKVKVNVAFLYEARTTCWVKGML